MMDDELHPDIGGLVDSDFREAFHGFQLLVAGIAKNSGNVQSTSSFKARYPAFSDLADTFGRPNITLV